MFMRVSSSQDVAEEDQGGVVTLNSGDFFMSEEVGATQIVGILNPLSFPGFWGN